MTLSFSQLTSWKGEVSRRTYLVWGLILFALKYNLDRLTAIQMDRTWFITDYFIQADKISIQELGNDDRAFFLILLLQSLPFIWFGTVLCVKRLRDAGLPPWLVIFFFIPFINFLLFVLLASLPEKSDKTQVSNSYLYKLIPKSRWGSAMFSMGIVIVISLAITGLLINYLNDYGWSLFVGIPFFLGFGSVLLYGYHRLLLYKQALGVALTSVVFFSLIVFIMAFEGIICIAMAFPIFFGIAFIGASIGYAIHSNRQTTALNIFIIPVIVLPLAGSIEHSVHNQPPTIHVQTGIVIDASKQKVWDQLVTFGKIDEPDELLFKTGISYPIHAEINARGVGAIRKCNFTTGSFIEPITRWEEPNLLEFGVVDQPPPMVEWSVYTDLQIAHLDGYFRSEKGQFKLEELPNGKTLLLGTTWYHHDVWPSAYWKLWSDYILHQIHKVVLTHIKKKAET
jgi:uncharacterized membrane protein YhaH (DUF805 family)